MVVFRLTLLARRVISRIRCLNRSKALGAIRRLTSGPTVKLNPRNFRSCGRATALFASFTLSGLNPKSETRRKDALCSEWRGKMAKMAKWRRHTVEFKRQAVERMKTCENIHALAQELKVERKLLYTWKYQFEGQPEPRHANLGKTTEERSDKKLRDEIAKLKSALADKTLEIDFFKSALLKIEADRQATKPGGAASMTSSGQRRTGKAR